jgi:hypothetical protein
VIALSVMVTDFLHRQIEPLGNRLDDADIRLMRIS